MRWGLSQEIPSCACSVRQLRCCNWNSVKWNRRRYVGWILTAIVLALLVVLLMGIERFIPKANSKNDARTLPDRFRGNRLLDDDDFSAVGNGSAAVDPLRINELHDDDTEANLLPVSQRNVRKIKPSDILVYSAMTPSYGEKYRNYINKNRQYCLHQGYNYSLLQLNMTTHHPSGYKIYSAINIIRDRLTLDMSGGQWLLYLDADAFVAETDIPVSVLIDAADKFANSISSPHSEPCHFIAQDQNHVVNSGVFLLRVSEWTLQFLEDWQAAFQLAETQWGLQLWVYDQGALQNTILHYAAHITGSTYNDSCVDRAHHANLCYHSTLSSFGFPYKRRSFGKICLVPPIGVPYSFHSHNSYSRGEFVHHRKGSLRLPALDVMTVEEIYQENSLYVDPKLHSIRIKNGTFIRYANPKALNPHMESIYIMLSDGLIHHIPDWPTFLSLGGGNISNVVLVSNLVFNSVAEGAPIPSSEKEET
jgi:hypothetical protein